MRLRRQSALFKGTALESLTLSIEIFNRPSPLARDHAVVMLLAHAFEMLLKAAIFQRRGTVRDRSEELTHSLLWAVADADVQGRIVAAHHAAVADVVGFMEREVAATRASISAGDGAVAQVEVRSRGD